MKFSSVNEILDYAMEKEEDAAQFYNSLADKMDKEYMKNVFLGFAKEEKGHKAKIQAIKDGKSMLKAEGKVMDLKIGDHLEQVDLDSEIDYQKALILAMKAEKNAYRLYHQLASAADDANIKEVFLALANEEAKHKLRFEIEYDDMILTEN